MRAFNICRDMSTSLDNESAMYYTKIGRYSDSKALIHNFNIQCTCTHVPDMAEDLRGYVLYLHNVNK